MPLRRHLSWLLLLPLLLLLFLPLHILPANNKNKDKAIGTHKSNFGDANVTIKRQPTEQERIFANHICDKGHGNPEYKK